MLFDARFKSALFLTLGVWLSGASAATVSAPAVVYKPMQIDSSGPNANETDTSPNPFLDIRYDLLLESPSGLLLTVPGFFAGDGNGNEQGNVWRARFTPDEPGEWRYTISLLSGANAAVLDQLSGLAGVGQHNDTGTFTVAQSSNASGFERYGRLKYVGEHYLKFSNGPYWIKGGLDSPENFFGYNGFDNTINQPGGVGEAQLSQGLHHYTNHVADWNPGDPLFSSKTSGVDSKGIIGAVNYLSSQGINSLYFLLMNLGGDGRDTYPFTGASGNNYDNTHYDISKLRQWNIVMEHMQAKGIAAHLVLGEQEEPNRNWLDNGQLGVQRKLYYREMVARFTHLNALKWNISEESRFGAAKHKSFAQTIRSLDWAKHPIAVHTFVDRLEKQYEPLLGNSLFTISSIQFSAENADQFTESWRKKSRDAGYPWVIDMDEVGPGNIGLTDSNSDEMRRNVLYPVYFSGGNIEWYFGFQGADIRTENFRTRESMYRYMRYAREFIERHLPFWEMNPDDNALVGGDANDQVFAKPGDVYALYLNRGNSEPALNVESGNYTVQWFNPRTGQMNNMIRKVSGATLSIGPSPAEPQQDWVVLVKNVDAANNSDDVVADVVVTPDAVDTTAEDVVETPDNVNDMINDPDTVAVNDTNTPSNEPTDAVGIDAVGIIAPLDMSDADEADTGETIEPLDIPEIIEQAMTDTLEPTADTAADATNVADTTIDETSPSTEVLEPVAEQNATDTSTQETQAEQQPSPNNVTATDLTPSTVTELAELNPIDTSAVNESDAVLLTVESETDEADEGIENTSQDANAQPTADAQQTSPVVVGYTSIWFSVSGALLLLGRLLLLGVWRRRVLAIRLNVLRV